jgi:delta(3,5)-delta(2,4)-dienoyl-CoA isomerase
MPKIIGNASAIREWALTGKGFSAEEALRFGFVSKVIEGGRDEVIGKFCNARRFIGHLHSSPHTAAALETAKIIASKSPIAVLGTKHLLLHAQDNTLVPKLSNDAISAHLATLVFKPA